jgi:hypothetical protein
MAQTIFENYHLKITDSHLLINKSEVIPLSEVARFEARWILRKSLWQEMIVGIRDPEIYLQERLMLTLWLRGQRSKQERMVDCFTPYEVSHIPDEGTHPKYSSRKWSKACLFLFAQEERREAILSALATAIEQYAKNHNSG